MQEHSRNGNVSRGRSSGRRNRNGNRNQPKRKNSKYAGYIRLTTIALVVIAVILVVNSVIRHSRPGDGDGGLVVKLDSSEEVLTSEAADDVPDETVPDDEKESIRKKEINSEDYRPIVKTKADLALGELVMVNRSNSWKFPNASAFIDKLSSHTEGKYKLSYNTHSLQQAAADALDNMTSDFYEVFMSKDMTVVTSLLTYSEQNGLYSPPASENDVIQNENQLSPGYTEHHTGYAVDFKVVSDSGQISAYDGTGNYKWINDNCYKYGFIIRYPVNKEEVTGMAANPSHFRYVGIPHSYIMRENNFTLEEYMNEMKKYIFGYEHLFYDVYGYEYEIYFVPADAEETVVPVPKNDAYTVSGNNCDGFIVTICRESDELKYQQPAYEPESKPAQDENSAADEAEEDAEEETEE